MSVLDLTQEELDGLLKSPILVDVMGMWNDFLDALCHYNTELSAFWMSYIDLIKNVLLGLLHSSHECYILILEHALIPWCFAYDKVNYSRYLSVQLS